MKKFVPIFLFLMLAISPSLEAQLGNLVPNPGFETFFQAPTSEGDLFEAVAWDNLNGGSAYPHATPDFFHTSGTGDAQAPSTFAGNIPPYEGGGVAGFITYNFFVPNYREYLGTPLASPMTVGQPYTVSFWLSNSASNHYASMGSNNIGIAFSVGAPSQNVNLPINIVPQVEINTVTYHNTWVQYSFTFTPTQAFDYMTIGNFRDDASTARTIYTSGYSMSYYFIDMIDVTEVLPLPIEGLDLARGGMKDGIDLQWTYPVTNSDGEWTLERSMDQKTFKSIANFTEAASGVQSYHDQSAHANLQYYYRMRHVNNNGEVEFSDLVAASFEGAKPYTASSVFPNPVVDQFSIEFATAENSDLRIVVVDMLGQTIFSDTREMEAGESIVTYNLNEELPVGTYFATFTFMGESFTRKIVSAAASL